MTPGQKLRLKELLSLRLKVEAKGQYLTRQKQAELKSLIELNHYHGSPVDLTTFDYGRSEERDKD